MAAAIMAAVMTSLAYVMVNSVVDTAYNRQRATALNLANQAVEEVRALPWSTVQSGLQTTDSGLCSDSNIYVSGVCGGSAGTTVYCFEDSPLDVGGTLPASSSCRPLTWSDPSCLAGSGSSLPSTLTSPAPLSPHEQCYAVGGRVYGIQVYLTGSAGPAAPPLTVTVVVSWAKAGRSGVADHVVTSTELSSCSLEAACI